MKYKVKIAETLSATVTVEADDEITALEKAEKLYYDCDVILMSDDFDDVSFTIKEVIENE